MDSFRVNSAVEFIRKMDLVVPADKFYLFRGQPVKGNLLPGVARKDPLIDSTAIEREVLEQFSLMGHSHLEKAGSTPLDLMVVAQHYGLRTRLLDWTSSYLAALWFACSDPKPGPTYVYALAADTFLVKDLYKQDPFDQKFTRAFQPRINNSRVMAQNGWFTLHRFATKDKRFVPLEKNKDSISLLTEFVISASSRNDILRFLDRSGVHSFSMLSDLGGLCQHLNSRHQLV